MAYWTRNFAERCNVEDMNALVRPLEGKLGVVVLKSGEGFTGRLSGHYEERIKNGELQCQGTLTIDVAPGDTVFRDYREIASIAEFNETSQV